MALDVETHEPADGHSSSSCLFPQQCLSPVQAELMLIKQTNLNLSKPMILHPSKLTNLSPSKQTDCKSVKSKQYPLLRQLPKQHPLLSSSESHSDDGEHLLLVR